MPELRISRRKILGTGAAGALGVLLTPQAVLAKNDEVGLLRWDIVMIAAGGVILAGGTANSRAGNGDTVALTGSGQAEPEEGRAAGGGTFVHRTMTGSLVAQGIYVVTGFNGFRNGGGSLAGVPGLTDGIGSIGRTSGGILSLNVSLRPAGGGSVGAVLEVHCALPGAAFRIEEGVRLAVGALKFVQIPDAGATLFHILSD